jgi:hypothetical protein
MLLYTGMHYAPMVLGQLDWSMKCFLNTFITRGISYVKRMLGWRYRMSCKLIHAAENHHTNGGHSNRLNKDIIY